MVHERFLARRSGDSSVADTISSEAMMKSSDEFDLIHNIGYNLLNRFWIPEPEFVSSEDLNDDIVKDGVYFNGKNIDEFHEQIRHGRIPFWKRYSRATLIEDPEELMARWISDNKRTGYDSWRTPNEILEQQYIGGGGGCGGYVAAMTEVVRASGIPVKIVFFLKKDDEMSEIKRVANGDVKAVGHYMGACFIDDEWRLYDFKWQWNPGFTDFYKHFHRGLENPGHRDNHEIRYIPVSNNAAYLPDEPISSENIGFLHLKNTPNIVQFAMDVLRKLE